MEKQATDATTRIFISHSHLDKEIAKKLVEYLLAALRIEDDNIRCTSVPNYMLPPGTNIEDCLKRELKGDIALIALLTKHSLRSKWVMFEIGAAWGMEKLVIPILVPGLNEKDLPGPQKNYTYISIDAQSPEYALNDMIQKLCTNLHNIKQKEGSRGEPKRNEFIQQLRAWNTQLTDPEETTNLVTELSRSNKELNEWKILHKVLQNISYELLDLRFELFKLIEEDRSYQNINYHLTNWETQNKLIGYILEVIYYKNIPKVRAMIDQKEYWITCQCIDIGEKIAWPEPTIDNLKNIETHSKNVEDLYIKICNNLNELLRNNNDRENFVVNAKRFSDALQLLEKEISTFLRFLDQKIQTEIDEFNNRLATLEKKIKTTNANI